MGRGDLPEDAFENLAFNDLVAYMVNNRIHVSFVQTVEGPVENIILRLVEKTRGLIQRAFD